MQKPAILEEIKEAFSGSSDEEIKAYVELLIALWSELTFDSTKESVEDFFEDEINFKLAVVLLSEGLLPKEAQKAIGFIFILGIEELQTRDIWCENLFLPKPIKGRNKNKDTRILEVWLLITCQRYTATDAYSRVAKNHFVSESTIRREYERDKQNNRGKVSRLNRFKP